MLQYVRQILLPQRNAKIKGPIKGPFKVSQISSEKKSLLEYPLCLVSLQQHLAKFKYVYCPLTPQLSIVDGASPKPTATCKCGQPHTHSVCPLSRLPGALLSLCVFLLLRPPRITFPVMCHEARPAHFYLLALRFLSALTCRISADWLNVHSKWNN